MCGDEATTGIAEKVLSYLINVSVKWVHWHFGAVISINDFVCNQA